jgi:predicted Zn-dependent protease
VTISSNWTGSTRWARNQVSSTGDVRNNVVNVLRNLNGAMAAFMVVNDTSDAALVAAARRSERLAALQREWPYGDLVTRYTPEQHTSPQLFSDATYQLEVTQRAGVAQPLLQSAQVAGMLSAGYIEVSAHCVAKLDTLGRAVYFPYTYARYSVTVRAPDGSRSGWAGVDSADWRTIDAEGVTARALEKCLRSRNPVRCEPGRYTTILEPQAVGEFTKQLVQNFDRMGAENEPLHPFSDRPGFSKLGQRVIDDRITLSADPMDPQAGFVPFDVWSNYSVWTQNQFQLDVYHKATRIERGILTTLAYPREYARKQLGSDAGLPNPGAFRMSVTGQPASLDEMIATTERGLLVTRFDQLLLLELRSVLVRGYTRDGVWLIENGKISKPVKNLVFTESVLGALNNVEQLGVPQRIFNPPVPVFTAHPQPMVVPPLKIRDFSFTALSDAI